MNTLFTAALAFALIGNEPNTTATAPETEALDLSIGALASSASIPTLAPTSAPDDGTLTWKWKNGLGFESADGQVKGKMGGRVFWDVSFLGLDESLEGAGFSDADGTEFRAARIFVELDLFGDYKFKAEYDFAGQDADFKDVYLQRKDVLGSADLKVGHFKEPFSLEELTSSRFITFGERGLPNAFAPGRNSGVLLSDTCSDEMFTWALGGFKDTNDAGTNAEDGGFAVTGRVTASPVYDDGGREVVHLGLAYSQRDQSMPAYSQRPEIHLSDKLLDTGAIMADSVTLAGAELAAVLGAFHAETEFMTTSVSGDGGPDFDGSGFYVQGGWFLTGESRPYKRSAGAFDRVIPNANYGDDGCGAWELTARYSSLDLTDGGVVGGQLDDITLGVNWYLNPNMRIVWNYVTGDVDLGGALDSEGVDALLMRVQVDW